MSRRGLILMLIPVVLIASVILGIQWLLHSGAGNQWVLARLQSQMGETLVIEGADGRLSEGLSVQHIQWTNDAMIVDVQGVQLRAELSLFPPSASVGLLRIERIDIHQAEQPTAVDESLDLGAFLSALALPLEIGVGSLELGPVTLQGPHGTPVVLLDGLEGRGDWSNSLRNLDLRLSGPWFDGHVSGRVDLTAPQEHVLNIDGRLPGLDDPGADDLQLTLAGNFNRTELTMSALNRSWILAGEVRELGDRPILELRLEEGAWSLTNDWRIYDMVGTLAGEPDEFKYSLRATMSGPGEQLIPLSSKGDGNLAGLPRFDLEADGRTIAATLGGELNWDSGFELAALLNIQHLALSAFNDSLPADLVLRGSTQLSGKEDLWSWQEGQFTIPDSELLLKSTGEYALGSGNVNGTVDWRGFAWPAGSDEAEWMSPEGSVSLRGQVDDWNLTTRLQLVTRDQSPGWFGLAASGNLEGARFHITEGEVLGGSLGGEGEALWSGDGLGGSVRLEARSVDVALLVPGWRSALNADLEVMVQPAGAMHFELAHLSGLLRSAAVNGQGDLWWDAGAWRADSLELSWGTSRVSMSGNMLSNAGLDAMLEIPRNSPVGLLLGGSMDGNLTLSQESLMPRLRADLSGGPWASGEYNVELWRLAGDSALEGLTLAAQSVRGPDLELEDLHAQVSLLPERASLNMKATTEHLRGSLGAEALPLKWRGFSIPDVAGELGALDLSRGDEVLLELSRAGEFRFDRGRFDLAETCLTTRGEGQVCASGSHDAGEGWFLDAELLSVPLAHSSLLFEHNLRFTQVLNGAFKWQKVSNRAPRGSLAVDVSPGQVGDEDDDSALSTAAGFIGFEIANGQLVGGQFDIPIPGAGIIDIDLMASNVTRAENALLSGKALVKLSDLSVLEAFTSSAEQMKGQLDLTLDIGGTLSKPVLDGAITLTRGGFSLPALGLTVSDLALEGNARGQGEANFRADFRVGDGLGSLLAEVDLTPGERSPFVLNLKGNRLRVMETPDLMLEASPDLTLSRDSEAWTLSGSLDIPRARLTPASTFVSRISESEDIEIVAGALAAPPPSVYQGERIVGALALSLGDDILLETDQAEASVEGQLALRWSGDPEPVATGNLAVLGQVAVFGPVLRISDGAIRFPGVPVSRPVLDLRAERDIFGNTQIRTAGVLVTGTPRRPVLEAYTTPFTTRERAWALLITGQDFEQGQNIGAFEVGTYIAPKIYVGYGVSLFDNENVVSVRYDLRRGFGVKATSGQRQSGLDISYTIER